MSCIHGNLLIWQGTLTWRDGSKKIFVDACIAGLQGASEALSEQMTAKQTQQASNNTNSYNNSYNNNSSNQQKTEYSGSGRIKGPSWHN